MDPWTEMTQLKLLEVFSTDVAIAIVEYSTSRTNCNNLITNGDHKRDPPESKSRSGRKAPTFEEMGL
jgi:hypothetical protein